MIETRTNHVLRLHAANTPRKDIAKEVDITTNHVNQIIWRDKNRDKYRAYQRRYSKTEPAINYRRDYWEQIPMEEWRKIQKEATKLGKRPELLMRERRTYQYR